MTDKNIDTSISDIISLTLNNDFIFNIVNHGL